MNVSFDVPTFFASHLVREHTRPRQLRGEQGETDSRRIQQLGQHETTGKVAIHSLDQLVVARLILVQPKLGHLHRKLRLLADAHLPSRVVQQIDVVALTDVRQNTGTRSRLPAETDAGAQQRPGTGRDKKRTPSARSTAHVVPRCPCPSRVDGSQSHIVSVTDRYPLTIVCCHDT